MTLSPHDRLGHGLLAVALLILASQPIWQLPEVLGRGRLLYWTLGVLAFLLLLATGLIGRPMPRPHPWRVTVALLSFHLVTWIAGHFVPAGPGVAPTGLEVSRVVLSRHLIAFEWTAIFLAAAALSLPPSSPSVHSGFGSGKNGTESRITPSARVVLLASLIAGLAFTMAGRGAGIGPVGAAAATLLFATGLALAAACQQMESDPDA